MNLSNVIPFCYKWCRLRRNHLLISIGMQLFGLIGYPLSHSFSKQYFTEKFQQMQLKDHAYHLFELPRIEDFPALWKTQPDLVGLNVTIPHKQAVIPYLDTLDPAAMRIGAVNVIKHLPDGSLRGYNSDYWGFKTSLERWLPSRPVKALILGTGGASKAVALALEDLGIPYQFVSRKAKENIWDYTKLDTEVLSQYALIINTTPLGMSPQVETAPAIPYEPLSEQHYLYDLVYNPAETRFMQYGKQQGAKVKNGLEMLHLQAEKAWEIWTEPS
ncbi:MAG: shikimate dehydrogenase [Bacteroidota bacterium]